LIAATSGSPAARPAVMNWRLVWLMVSLPLSLQSGARRCR